VFSLDWLGLVALLDDGSDLAKLDRIQCVCTLGVAVTDVSGASVSIAAAGVNSTVCGTDAVSLRLEDLQFGLGEGPVADTLRRALPMRAPDLSDASDSRWPWFAPAAVLTGARALFVLPLCPGGRRLGTLSLYRSTAGALGSQHLADARVVARAASSILSSEDTDPWASPGAWACGDGSGFRAEIHQAVGATMARFEVGAGTAMARLRAHAYVVDRSLGDVADDVVAGRLHLEPHAA
jgi:ANTAR domain